MGAHAIHAASSAHRWMACPGSINLIQELQRANLLTERTSKYAVEGTGAHELGARCLRNPTRDPEDFIGQYMATETAAPVEVTQEMADAVQVYVDHVRSISSGEDTTLLFVEQLFDLAKFYPGLFGTADACVFHKPDLTLHVIDYKHGQGIAVEADGNPQLRYYGLGALVHLQSLKLNLPMPERVVLTIVQPRCPHQGGPVRSETVTSAALLNWTEELLDAVHLTEQRDAKLSPGDHCRFCPASPRCPALYDKSIAAAQMVFTDVQDSPTPGVLQGPTPVAQLSNMQLQRALLAAELLEPWIKDLHAYAIEHLGAGQPIPGWKLVQKRAMRKWGSDNFIVIPELERMGLKLDDILEAPTLRSPAQVEKLLPPKRRGELTPFIAKESSGVTLAPEADPRPAVITALPFDVIKE